MLLKGVVDEDFINYKKPSMFLMFPQCSFKCCREIGKDICQNSSVANLSDISCAKESICRRYIDNPITKAIVCGGLEPFDTFQDLYDLIQYLRWDCDCHDDVVIYTGYYPEEIFDKLSCLNRFDNIIVKFGRFIPDQAEHFDEVLGVNLASENQWAEVIS